MKKLNEVSGHVYWNGRLRSGSISVSDGRISFSESKKNEGATGTIIPAPVNSHTHIGDSFISEEPMGSLPEVVGPGGFKHSKLLIANDEQITAGMERSIRFMEENGTALFIDFRENGAKGVEMIKKIETEGVQYVMLGRPSGNEDIEDLLKRVDGVGISSLSDEKYDALLSLTEKAKSLGKIVAMHFSEHIREDIDKILNLRPDLLIHGIESNNDDLLKISDHKIPIVITPRSNLFFGKRPDYSMFLKHGIELLLGTDNVMLTEPDIFAEMEFLYRYQRSIGRFDPNVILNMTIDNPRRFLMKFGIHPNVGKYVFYPNRLLTEFEIVSRPSCYKKIPVLLE